MSRPADLIASFKSGGKTFYFNKRVSVRGVVYIVITTVSDSGGIKEKLVLFPNQLPTFLEYLKKASEKMLPEMRRYGKLCPSCKVALSSETCDSGVVENQIYLTCLACGHKWEEDLK